MNFDFQHMFDGIIGFAKDNPFIVMVAGGFTLVVFAVTALIIYFRNKNRPAGEDSGIDGGVEAVEDVATASPRAGIEQSVVVEAPVPAAATAETTAPPAETANALTVAKPEPTGVKLKIGKKQKYRAIILRRPKWWASKPRIEFKNRIDQPVGAVWSIEPSAPVHGDAYFIKENRDHTFSPWDPREEPVSSDDTPGMAYQATHWARARGVWLNVNLQYERISMFVVVGLMILTFLIIVIKLGS